MKQLQQQVRVSNDANKPTRDQLQTLHTISCAYQARAEAAVVLSLEQSERKSTDLAVREVLVSIPFPLRSAWEQLRPLGARRGFLVPFIASTGGFKLDNQIINKKVHD